MPKAAALTSSLLARKGEAMPAMVSASFSDPTLAWEDNDSALRPMGGGAVIDRPLHVTPPRPMSSLLTPVGHAPVRSPEPVRAPAPDAPIRFRRIKADNIPADMIPCFSIPVLVAPPVRAMDEGTTQAPVTAPVQAVAKKKAKSRVRVSLRLPETEYMQLKLLAVSSRRSMQDILFDALAGAGVVEGEKS